MIGMQYFQKELAFNIYQVVGMQYFQMRLVHNIFFGGLHTFFQGVGMQYFLMRLVHNIFLGGLNTFFFSGLACNSFKRGWYTIFS